LEFDPATHHAGSPDRKSGISRLMMGIVGVSAISRVEICVLLWVCDARERDRIVAQANQIFLSGTMERKEENGLGP
jgi:hypothetical protein